MKTLGNKRRANTDDDDDQLSVNIPLELVISEIFTRLPVKSLCRFRCVSKSIRSLTQNNNLSFIDLHLSRSQTRPESTTLLISVYCIRDSHQIFSAGLDGGPLTPLLKLPHVDDPNGSVSHCVNGLLCVSVALFSSTCSYVCNPNTRQFLKLRGPRRPIIRRGFTHQRVCYFLGFDPSTTKFKALHVRISQSEFSTEANATFWVLTLGGGRGGGWRKLPLTLSFDDGGESFDGSNSFDKCVCLNGAMHWLLESENQILVFDLKYEKFHVMPLTMPLATRVVVVGSHVSTVLIEVKGCLAIVPSDQFNKMMVMWVLEDYQRHVWIEHIIGIDFSSYPSYRNEHFYPVGSIPTGEILLLPFKPFSLGGVRIPLLYYDMKNRSSRFVEITQLPVDSYFDVVGMTTCTENLFFPKMGRK